MAFVDANGIRIWCETRGQGPRLLALTGTGTDLRKAPTILDSPLVERFEVATYDQRGLGRSDKPDSDYSMADYGLDAIGVLDALGWQRACVLGVSFGGLVAQELAVRAPERVRRLVLCCTAPGGEGGSLYPQHLLHRLTPREKVLHMLPIADARRDAAWQAANLDVVERLVETAENDPYLDEPGARDGRRRQIDARGNHDAWDRLHLITAPTLVCIGRYDRQAEPAVQERMAARIRGSRVRYFEGGHMFMGQDPEAVPAVMDFLLQDQAAAA